MRCGYAFKTWSLLAGYGMYKLDNTRKILKSGEVAPPKEGASTFPELKCENPMHILYSRDGASGVFMLAHNFPKSRETRPVKIAELVQHRERLPEKLAYLADAPTKRPRRE